MSIGRREKLVAGLVLAACAVAAGRHAANRPAVDPCDADPGAYACAMFAQPEWQKRRVYAGRMEIQPRSTPIPSAAVDAVAMSADVIESGADGI